MSISSRNLFSDGELAQINEAVRHAEMETSGEIVPVLATSADAYDRGLFYAALTFALLATLGVVAFFFLPLPFLVHDPWNAPVITVLPCQIAGLLAGYHVARAVPGLHRAFVPRALMQLRVNQAAQRAFQEHRVAATQQATGIMIYVSLFERVAVILADKAINERHDPSTWDGVRDLLLDGFKQDRAVDGYVRAIAECGRILKQAFPIQPDDKNELPNHLRML